MSETSFPASHNRHIDPSDDNNVTIAVLKAWADRANEDGGFYDEDLEIPWYTLREWGNLSKEHDFYKGLDAFELSPEHGLLLRTEYRDAKNPEDILHDANGEYDETAGELVGGLIAAVLRFRARFRLDELAETIEYSKDKDSQEDLAVLLEEEAKIKNGEYPDSVTKVAIEFLVNTPFGELLDDYKKSLEAELPLAIQHRIDSNEFPWTLSSNIDKPEKCEQIQQVFEYILGDPRDEDGDRLYEPKPDDVFNVRPFLGSGGFCREDQELVGMQDGIYSRGFTRQELKDKGVFFVNSIGDGEQPIFGVPIPDESADDGYFHPERRAFLTEDEFKKVYEYQMKMLAESDLDMSALDIPDIQRSLIMVCLSKPNSETAQVIKRGGRERDADGGWLRSPFVDSGFCVRKSIGTLLFFHDGSGGGTGYHGRINTTSIVLLNGHPDYPGLSEMAPPIESTRGLARQPAWDQLYIGLKEMLGTGILAPMPTNEEALAAVTSGTKTRREECWRL